MPFLRNAPEGKEARRDYFVRRLHDLGALEARMNLMTILANTGTMTTNLYGGAAMNISSAGLKNFIDSKRNSVVVDKLLTDINGNFVLKTKDGKYHIIDWKTCSWGWDMRKRSDPMVTYQLTLYKKFFCQKHNIAANMVETHFAVLKRTAKSNNVEIFRVTSGPRKTTNANDLLLKAITNIHRQIKFKNRMSCDRCEFRKTEHCT